MKPPTRSDRHHPMPFTRLEIVLLGMRQETLQVLLARRSEAPHAGRWALPGGALRIDLDDGLESAARRVMRERLSIDLPFLYQLCAEGGPSRDPRAPWALSIVYRALVRDDVPRPTPGKRVSDLAWRSVDEVIRDPTLAFDHAALIARAVKTTRDEIERLDLHNGLMPDQFTLGELQSLCENLLGKRLDKSSFRRRLADRDLCVPMEGAMRTGPNRPAQIYRLRTGPVPGSIGVTRAC